jgi:2-keto-3-deoxy-L-rhamnonate aldolase RhmA
MSSTVGENHAKRTLAAGELVLCMGVNQMRTPNIAMIAAACGFDAIYIDLEHTRPRSRRPRLSAWRHSASASRRSRG